MKVEILGTGCAKCQKLYRLVEQAVADTGSDAEVVKVEKMDEIMSYGVPFTPALVIDGTVKSVGNLPKPAQLEAWLREGAGQR
ncbi:MAG: thioredoxin family protein [Deltaproteobacteria bacterium]|nr:thioredoxin family protein [Deltaproteobacteria bacterium]